MTINNTTPIDDAAQIVSVTITHGSDSYDYDANTPKLEGDELQAHCDANEFKWLNNILYQVYGRNIQFPTLDEWDEWIAAGCKLEEITKTTVTPAQPAVDAVMGERQVIVESEVDEEVSTTEIVEVDGKFVEKTTTETVTKTVSTPQFTEHQLYNEDGTAKTRVVTEAVEAVEAVEGVEGVEAVEAVEAVAATLYEEGDELPEGKSVGDEKTAAIEAVEAVEAVAYVAAVEAVAAVAEVTEPVLHSVPRMESYTISEPIAAVAEQSETVVVRAETVVEKVAWKDTAE